MNNARSAPLFRKEVVQKERSIFTAFFLTNPNAHLPQSRVPQVSLAFSGLQE